MHGFTGTNVILLHDESINDTTAYMQWVFHPSLLLGVFLFPSMDILGRIHACMQMLGPTHGHGSLLVRVT